MVVWHTVNWRCGTLDTRDKELSLKRAWYRKGNVAEGVFVFLLLAGPNFSAAPNPTACSCPTGKD